MKKVICIDASPGKHTGTKPEFKEGEILTATQSKYFESSYIIEEYPTDKTGKRKPWYKSRFIPLSEIDELELVNEKQLVNQ